MGLANFGKAQARYRAQGHITFDLGLKFLTKANQAGVNKVEKLTKNWMFSSLKS